MLTVLHRLLTSSASTAICDGSLSKRTVVLGAVLPAISPFFFLFFVASYSEICP
jgi:hypothetical protein